MPRPELLAPLESALERRVVKYARTLGIESIKLNLHGRRDWPDRMFFPRGGRPVLFELKRVGKEPRPGQLRVIRWLKKLGYEVYVIDTFTEAKVILDGAV